MKIFFRQQFAKCVLAFALGLVPLRGAVAI